MGAVSDATSSASLHDPFFSRLLFLRPRDPIQAKKAIVWAVISTRKCGIARARQPRRIPSQQHSRDLYAAGWLERSGQSAWPHALCRHITAEICFHGLACLRLPDVILFPTSLLTVTNQEIKTPPCKPPSLRGSLLPSGKKHLPSSAAGSAKEQLSGHPAPSFWA